MKVKAKIVMSRNSWLIPILLLMLFQCSCKKFLDAKSNKTTFVPSSLLDLQAILDNDDVMNQSAYPQIPESGADNYYLTYNDWASLYFLDDQKSYIWEADAGNFGVGGNGYDWNATYRVVQYANTVLDNITQIPITTANSDTWKSIKGAALFFRSYAFYHVAEVYCKPYNSSTASTDLGIPLRLNSGIDQLSVRSTVQQSYDQIINDLKTAASLLPVTSLYPTRPNKPAAFGALARIYLSMRDYVDAGLYADSCLQLYNSLLDYNSLNANSAGPIPTFNTEVIFHNTIFGKSMDPSIAKVDSNLYQSYATNDLRKIIFFASNNNGTYGFKGTYDGTIGPSSGAYFNGIATDEVYLMRAECTARAGNNAAIADLNTLMVKRWKTGTFVAFTATTASDALSKILIERRKELCFRALRWSDLRRFNLEGANITLTRILNGQVYTLPPNDLRWVILIPPNVINNSTIQQNPR